MNKWMNEYIYKGVRFQKKWRTIVGVWRKMERIFGWVENHVIKNPSVKKEQGLCLQSRETPMRPDKGF